MAGEGLIHGYISGQDIHNNSHSFTVAAHHITKVAVMYLRSFETVHSLMFDILSLFNSCARSLYLSFVRKVKGKGVCLCLTKYRTMKIYPVLN
jgi:hypothetical protein